MTDSRPPSVVSSGTDYDNEDYAGELWDELEVVLQACSVLGVLSRANVHQSRGTLRIVKMQGK
jgi:hypothetical protein